MQTSLHSALDEIDAPAWDALDDSGNPFLRHAFLAGAERHGAVSPALGWQPQHIALRDDDGCLVGALPLYQRAHSFGDFSGDWHWSAAIERAGYRYFPKLVSGIPYTPASGPRLLVRPDAERAAVVGRLIDAALERVAVLGASSWQCLFIEPDAALKAELEQRGLLLRRGCLFHWHNRGYSDFEDHLADFSAEKRKKARRERRRVVDSGLSIEIRHGDEIDTALWAQIYPHYRSTFSRFGNHAAFPQSFFAEIGARLQRDLVVFLARDADRVVAAAICYRSGTTLYGRHWGAEAQYDSLHFELCFHQGIEYCIRHGLSTFEPGAQGEHKISRGFSPTATWSAFWIAEPALRLSIGAYLRREQAAVGDYAKQMTAHAPYRKSLG